MTGNPDIKTKAWQQADTSADEGSATPKVALRHAAAPNRTSNIAASTKLIINAAEFARHVTLAKSAGSGPADSSGREEKMSEVHVHRVQPAWKKNALIDNETYLKWYADSIKNPDRFWGKHGKRIDWFKP